MAISHLLTGSARTREVILPAQAIGSIITGSHGSFVGLPVASKTIDLNGSVQAIPVDLKNHLQAAFANNSSSLIDAINFNQTSLQSLESGQDLDFSGGSGGSQSVSLSSEALSFAAGTGLASVGTSNTITYNLNTALTSLAGISNAAASALADLSDAEVGILDDATVTTAELNYLDNDALTAADFTKLAAVDSTAVELNIVDGGTSATATTLVAADRVVVNDNGTMVQVAMSDFETFMESNLDTLNSVTSATSLASIGTITTGVWQGTAIAQAYIAGNAINESKIADDAVGVAQIVAQGVGTAEIKDAAILGGKLAANVVKASGYVVLNADPDTAGGLVLRGEDTDGSAQDYVLQVDGGMLSLRMISTVSESGVALGAAGS